MAKQPSKYSFFSKSFFRGIDARHDARSRFANMSFSAVPVTPSPRRGERLGNRSCSRFEDNKTFSSYTPLTPRSPLALSVDETMMSFCSSLGSTDDSISNLSFSMSMSPSFSPISHDLRLQGWMYWERSDDLGDQQRSQQPRQKRYTKVFAVLRNEFLLLYRNSARGSGKRPNPLVQIAVANVSRTEDGAFLVQDPYGETMELHLYNRNDETATKQWEAAFEQASELTQWHFSAFDVKVEDLSRGSMYRGTLHDIRMQSARSAGLRRAVNTKLKSWGSLRNVLLPVTRIAHLSRRSAP